MAENPRHPIRKIRHRGGGLPTEGPRPEGLGAPVDQVETGRGRGGVGGIVNAYYDSKRSIIELATRAGPIEVDWPDIFYVAAAESPRLPTTWQDHIEQLGNGYARVRWPELYGSRKGRLKHYQETVFGPRGVVPLEADVDPVQRFLIENPKLQLERNLRLLYLDLETERVADWDAPWRSRILSISWRSSSGEFGHLRIEALTDQAEAAMLTEFKRIMNRHDVILAWSGKRFDFKVLKSRLVERGLPFQEDLYHWLDHLTIFKKSYKSEDGGTLSSHALNHVAEHVLGEKKVPVEKLARERGWDGRGDQFIWVWEHAPDLLREYNDVDVELMAKIEAKTQLIQLHLSLCSLCRVLPTEWSMYVNKLIDGRLFQRGFEAGYHFPTKEYIPDPDFEVARGAFVPESVIGLHESVAVVDYARMYPSIILTFNMSMETLSNEGDLRVPETDLKGQLTGNTVARFKSAVPGHLPVAIRGVLAERKQYEKRRAGLEVGSPAWHDADTLSNACKVLANSFYGVLLSPTSRYFEPALGESVTSFGRLLLANTMAVVEGRGHKFIFGDTDSTAFVATDEEAAAVRDAINNDMVPRLLESTGAKPGDIAIDYEKRFARVLVTRSKKYAGRFAIFKGKPVTKPTTSIKGLEMIRSDVCQAARALQRVAVEMALDGCDGQELRKMVQDARAEVLAGVLSVEKLTLSKALSKDPADYATKVVQVKVAEQMIEAGMQADEGSKIPFLLTRAGPIHPTALKDPKDLDLQEYWDKQIYPASERVLEAAYPGLGWERLYLPRNYHPDQPELFAPRELEFSPPPAPTKAVRRVRKVTPEAVPDGNGRTAGRLTLKVDERATDALTQDLVSRLKKLVTAFPGDYAVSVWVMVWAESKWQIVEIDTPARALAPERDATFAAGLRSLGVRWESAEGR